MYYANKPLSNFYVRHLRIEFISNRLVLVTFLYSIFLQSQQGIFTFFPRLYIIKIKVNYYAEFHFMKCQMKLNRIQFYFQHQVNFILSRLRKDYEKCLNRIKYLIELRASHLSKCSWYIHLYFSSIYSYIEHYVVLFLVFLFFQNFLYT